MIKNAIILTKVLIIIFSVSILFATPVMALYLMPHGFYGNVLVDGSPAVDGLTVTAAIAGATFPYSVGANTSGGSYGYSPNFLKVPADDPDTDIKEGGVEGDVITFYVDGFVAGSYSFEIGQVTRLDLSVTTPPPPTTAGRRSLPDPSTFAMAGSGLAVFLFYIGLSGLRRKLCGG